MSIKEVSRITKKIPININYYEHCNGKCDEILARSLVLYALSKKQGLGDKQIKDLILAYIVYKADKLQQKDFVLINRKNLLSVFAEDFNLKDLKPIKKLIEQFNNKATLKNTETELMHLVEAYGNQLMDRTFLQKNKASLLSSPAAFQQKNKGKFNDKNLESLVKLF